MEAVVGQNGIKEVSELIDGLQMVAVLAKKVMADGKIGVNDFPILMDAMKNVGTLTDALHGVENIPSELKDLNEEEAKALISKVFALVAAIKAA